MTQGGPRRPRIRRRWVPQLGRWQDWLLLALGIWFFISPWILNIPSHAGYWNAWLSGAGVIVLALWALSGPGISVVEWATLLLGAWIFISPWVLHTSPVPQTAWDAWLTGAAIFLLSLWSLSLVRARSTL